MRRLLLFALLACAPAFARPVPVILTFDTELDPDAEAIEEIALEVPVTYFFTTTYALRHPFLARSLAQAGNTVGSHGYDHTDLTTLDATALAERFRWSKLVHRVLTGSALRWYRAPFLSANDTVWTAMHDAGIAFDSSAPERWRQKSLEYELPVSMAEATNLLAADVKLFGDLKLEDADALKWLVARYDERERSGRPLVVLLHPRLIAQHLPVLQGLIAHVRERGGRFLSADGYAQEGARECAHRFAAWIDTLAGPAQQADALAQAGVTDALILARSTEGVDYFGREPDAFGAAVAAFRARGLRVHAWLPLNLDPQLALAHPDWAMRESTGGRSRQWVSPEQAPVIAEQSAAIRELLTRYPLDGLHVDYLRYPDVGFDFSSGAVAAVAAATGIPDPPRAQFAGGAGYTAWVQWRKQVIVDELARIAAQVRGLKGQRFELSAALLGGAAVTFKSEDEFGVDYARLAPLLDFVTPMAYFTQDHEPEDWPRRVAWSARYLAGDTPVLLGLPAFGYAGAPAQQVAQFRRTLAQSARGADGEALFSSTYLLRRAPGPLDLPEAALGELRGFIAARKAAPDGACGDEGMGSPE